MKIEPQSPDGAPPPRRGLRDPGDAWVIAPDGSRYWGRFGAAGLLAFDPDRGILLQHRVAWSHFGGTWALPGGARHAGESAYDAALRESAEEAGVPAEAVAPRLTSVLELGAWSYTTLVADVIRVFEPVISDPESLALSWVPTDRVAAYPLHPAFAAAWPRLHALLPTRPVVVVDAANVIGAVPDGWWRDRAGAAGRLLAETAALAARGVPAQRLDLPEHTWYPAFDVVLEGVARDAADPGGIRVIRAAGHGDDAIVATAEERRDAGHAVTAVTSDRALAQRLRAGGAVVRSVAWLREML